MLLRMGMDCGTAAIWYQAGLRCAGSPFDYRDMASSVVH